MPPKETAMVPPAVPLPERHGTKQTNPAAPPATSQADRELRHSCDLASRGDMAAAEKIARDILLKFPEHGPARLHLARLLLASGRPLEAIPEMEYLLAGHTPGGSGELETLLVLTEAFRQTGEMNRAETCGRRALAMAPHDARTKFTLALVCQQAGQLGDALALFDEGLHQQPDTIHAWVNKGLIEKKLGRLDEAIASFTKALSLEPAIAPVCYSLGLIHLMRGARGDAERSFRKALEIDPRHIHAALQLATLLRYENRMDEAADVYRAILLHDTGNVTARFHLDALQQPAGPARVPADVVRAIYADKSVGSGLEGSLRGHLKYQTPAILEAALLELHGKEQPVLDVLDLGCGSGLYGALVRPRAKRLVGVDLSASMIKECRRKQVYDDLHVRDVVDYLSETKEVFDLIVAMDVLCYFGDLRQLIYHCAGILKPGGILAFSVERVSDDSAWQFHRYGHFLHSAAHLRDATTNAGMREIQLTECALRRELGEDRQGFVALFALPT